MVRVCALIPTNYRTPILILILIRVAYEHFYLASYLYLPSNHISMLALVFM